MITNTFFRYVLIVPSMTSSPPAEATHFRGKTLSPASPRPLHIPEPQNIPVLQNQIDPHFNLMSTHMAQPAASQRAMASDSIVQQYYSDIVPPDSMNTDRNTRGTTNRTDGSFDGGREGQDNHNHPLTTDFETRIKQEGADDSQNHMNQSDSELPASVSSYEKFSAPAKNNPTPLPSDQNQVSSSINRDTANIFDNPQDAFVTQSRNAISPRPGPVSIILAPKLEPDVKSEGVNYQALLDILTPSSSTAPPAENIASISTTSSSRTPNPLSPSSLQTPIATLPMPAGLPARPPPQEKPAIHPNYTPGEDIRSYHKPPVQGSNAPTSYNVQSNNPQRPTQGYIHNNGVAPNGMPPPPLATFQQPMPTVNQPQRSPQTQHFFQKENQRRNGGRQAPEPYDGEDQYSRRPDIERSYEQFLQDEAIYVSEGTWDRFPQGSRLFVG